MADRKRQSARSADRIQGESWFSREGALRAAPWLVLALAALVPFAGIGSHSLWTPDEPTGAAVGKSMLVTGDLVVPRLNGRPFLEKPPLYWWVQVVAFRLFGVSDAAARVPSALFASLTLLATFAFGKRLGGPRLGLLAVGVLATTAELNEDMGRVVVDPALVFFVALCHFGFAVLAVPRSRREARLAAWLIACAAPCAFLVKGVVGLGLGAGPPVLYLLAAERGRAVRRLLPVAALALPVFAAAVLPWALALAHAAGWSALRECLVGNTVGRLVVTAATRVYGHRQPFWYYLVPGMASLLPWVLGLPAMLRAGLWGREDLAGTDQGQPGTVNGRAGTVPVQPRIEDGQATMPRRLLLATCGLGVLLLSLASTKRGLYLLPLLPAFAACVAWWLAGMPGWREVAAEGARSPDSPPAPAARSWDRPTLLTLLGLAGLVASALALAAAALRWGPRLGARIDPWRAVLSAPGLAGIAVLAAVGSAILLARLARHLARRSAPPPATLIAAYLFVFLAWQTAGKALVDPLKDLHGMTAAVARLDPGPGPVAAYRPSESVLAIVGFDLGRQVLPLAEPRDLAAYFANRPRGLVLLALDTARQLPPAFRARLRLLYDETGRQASPFGLAACDHCAK
jgi:4-amino-4-deoxy-L-arabinose transferase-like glycosyltransferase